MVTLRGIGGRRHHQVMRRLTGLAELRSLADAELVLFVDHDEAELGELDVVLQDGLRAHDDVDRAGLDLRENLPPLRRPEPADQRRPANPALAEQFSESPSMLPGQHFRRGHDRRLPAVCDGRKYRVHRDDRLAAPDFSLQ